MTANVGNIDRIVRAALGVVLLLAALFGGLAGTWMYVALLVGVVLLGTAGMRFCPAYRLLGMNTCKL